MNKYLILILCISLGACGIEGNYKPENESKTTILQPDSTGKDAMIHQNWADINWGNHTRFTAATWVWDDAKSERGLIEFDLKSIPQSSVVTKAFLYLYHNEDSNGNPNHFKISGSNACVIQRVSSSWIEGDVTWNNQPSSTTEGQIVVPQSDSARQDYKIDVTALVKTMIKDSVSNNGFLLKLADETPYRGMMFASSDHPNKNLHPKLEVTYTEQKKSISK